MLCVRSRMDYAGEYSLPLDPIKSKKARRSSVNKERSAEEAVEAPDLNPLSSKSSEKPVHPSRRSLTRRQVREAAKRLRNLDLKPADSPCPLACSGTPRETQVTKPNTSKTLPERYEKLDRLFSSVVASIRLLGLEKSPAILTNVSCMVEKTTNMRFAYSDLVQFKIIFPEVFKISKVYFFDKQTESSDVDLLLTLNFDIIPNVKKLKNLKMKKLFRSRLFSYTESNPKGDEVLDKTLLYESLFDWVGLASLDVMECPDVGTIVDSIRGPDHSFTKVAAAAACANLPETPVKSFDLGKEGDIISSMDEDSMMSRSGARKYTPKENKMPPLKRASYTDDVSDMLSEICLAPSFSE